MPMFAVGEFPLIFLTAGRLLFQGDCAKFSELGSILPLCPLLLW
jgi:hypothetical protein